MKINKDAIFLLTDSDSSSGDFGTGFAVDYKESRIFIVTCAHVIRKFNGIKANGDMAELLFVNDAIDIAILSVPYKKNEYPPLLNSIIRGETGMKINICGYSLLDKNTHVKRNIEGILGESIHLGGCNIDAWDISIDDKDIFSKMKKGYSGSPICDDAGGLIAVANYNIGTGEFGHAISISNIEKNYAITLKIKKNILLIDDDNDWCSVLNMYIDNERYKIINVESIEKAFNIFRDKNIKFDLVCINIGLEGDHIKYSFIQKWIALFKELKEREESIIVITGNKEINCITESENNLFTLKEIIYEKGKLPCDATPFLYKGSCSLKEEFLSYINQMITI